MSKEKVYASDGCMIVLIAIALITLVVTTITGNLRADRAEADLAKLEIEYIRLKTAMLILNIEDFVEVEPGKVEMKVRK